MPDVQIQQLATVRKTLDDLAAHRKEAKEKWDQLVTQASTALVSLQKRYIDISGKGDGPFVTLKKNNQEGTFNKERLHMFFQKLFEEQKKRNVTPEEAVKLVEQFLATFSKRSLTVDVVKHQPRTNTVHDLLAWLNGED